MSDVHGSCTVPHCLDRPPVGARRKKSRRVVAINCVIELARQIDHAQCVDMMDKTLFTLIGTSCRFCP
jgi:predicted transcriptional regulator